MTNWLTETLWLSRHSRHSSTRTPEALKRLEIWGTRWALGHLGTRHSALEGHLGTQGTQGTWALKALGHSKGTWALGHPRHLDTWTLRHLGTQALERHLGTQALGHLGTPALKALEALYLADSSISCFKFSFRCHCRIIIKYFNNFFSCFVKYFNIFY